MKPTNFLYRFFLGLSSAPIALIAVAILLQILMPVNPAQSAPLLAINPTPQIEEPGLVITGYVSLVDSNGTGLDNVSIYRSYSAYPGSQIAITNLQGYYDSGYCYIPGYELVTVWATQDGYNLEPQQYNWGHYGGLEKRQLDFIATPLVTNCPTPPNPNRILVDRGTWNTIELDHQLKIGLGSGATAITVTSEAGIVTETGNLLPSVSIMIPLLPSALHHLMVEAKFVQEDGCFYLTGTAYDRWGFPLTIDQQLPQERFLPFLVKEP